MARGGETIERGAVTVLHHRVDRIRLLQLKYQLLHSLHGVVPAQIDHHLLDLHKDVAEHISVRNWKT